LNVQILPYINIFLPNDSEANGIARKTTPDEVSTVNLLNEMIWLRYISMWFFYLMWLVGMGFGCHKSALVISSYMNRNSLLIIKCGGGGSRAYIAGIGTLAAYRQMIFASHSPALSLDLMNV
jgi:hypothetical protein